MDDTPRGTERPIFDARLTPHRSLDPSGFKILMAATFVASAALQPAVLSHGRLADRRLSRARRRARSISRSSVNYRAARAYEHFRLTYFELRFARANAAGLRREWRFAPAWVRFERVDHEEFGPQRLSLHSRGRRWDVARFLGPDQKAEFADKFNAARSPRRARGPRYSD